MLHEERIRVIITKIINGYFFTFWNLLSDFYSFYLIIYDTPITDDVLGGLSIEECKDYCNQIKQLPMRK